MSKNKVPRMERRWPEGVQWCETGGVSIYLQEREKRMMAEAYRQTFFQNSEKKRESTSEEKPGRHRLNQVMKLTSPVKGCVPANGT